MKPRQILLPATSLGTVGATVWFRNELFGWIVAAWESIQSQPRVWDYLAQILTGISVGVLAGWLSNRWQRNQLGNLRRSLASLEHRVQKAGEDARESIPAALAGPFTQSLWSYHPYSSQAVVRILSDVTKDVFSKNWQRTIVTEGRDLYRITGIRAIPWPAERTAHVWDLDYRIEWTWKNDSQVEKNPVNDLIILVTSPIEAVRNFGEDPARASARYQRVIDGHLNRIVIPVSNPLARDQPLPQELRARLETLFKIESFEFTPDGPPVNVPGGELERVPINSPGVYLALRVPSAYSERLGLGVGKSMSVAYSGTTTAEVDPTEKSKLWGALVYPPSDIGGSRFVLGLLHPEELEFEGYKYRLSLERKRSNCRYVHEPAEIFANPDDMGNDLPKTFKPMDGVSKLAAIRIGENPLTYLHLLSVYWQAEPVKAVLGD